MNGHRSSTAWFVSTLLVLLVVGSCSAPPPPTTPATLPLATTEPTLSPSRTPSATPGPTDTPVLTPQATPAATPAPPSTSAITGKLFGPFNISPSEASGWPFSVSRYGFDPDELEIARANDFHILAALTGGHSRFTDTDGCFSLEMWRAAFDRWEPASIQPYVDDGTIVGLYAIDEPHDWGNSCGPTYTDLNAMCQHVHERLPNLACGFNTAPEWLEQGLNETDFGEVDYLFTQYNLRQGNIHHWVERQFDHARWFDGDIWLSFNVVTGSPTPEQIREIGTVLCQSDAVGVTLWKWGPRFEEPGMREAMEAIAEACRGE